LQQKSRSTLLKITQLKLSNFRCFKDVTFTFEKPFVVIEGNNGVGKTSILEALHYACYLRSFRTRKGRELVSFENDHFFIQVHFQEIRSDLESQIQVGFSDNEKVVKLKNQQIRSFKELVDHYRIVSITEDDLELIKGQPEFRRMFLDQVLFLRCGDYVSTIRAYKSTLHNRNALIAQGYKYERGALLAELKVWTQLLWEQSCLIQKQRADFLVLLEDKINSLMAEYFSKESAVFSVKLAYKQKYATPAENFDQFWAEAQELLADEVRQGRTLFGAHLDDFSIAFRNKHAKFYASRGQQKLVLFLTKIAQLQLLEDDKETASLLLDDFLTDLDQETFALCLEILKKQGCQVFITCPLKAFIVEHKIPNFTPQIIRL
jgi:DNA replication and repair protein RecF